MRINAVSSVSYQAQMPKNVHDVLFEEARNRGHEASFACLKQFDNVKKWGAYDTSLIELFVKKTKQGSVKQLGLINYYLVPLKQALFPQKGTLLDSFLALTEKDIINAEDSLKI